MDTCTDVSTRGTTLLSRAGLLAQAGTRRPRIAPRSSGVTEPRPVAWRGQEATCATVGVTFGAFQGGAMTLCGQAAVIDRMVTDHQYSTRPGLSSCSPPV